MKIGPNLEIDVQRLAEICESFDFSVATRQLPELRKGALQVLNELGE